jgi:hypothetical protein
MENSVSELNSLYAHGTRECVSDQDTINIYGTSSPHMCVFQTTCTLGILYRNWPPALTTVSLYTSNTVRLIAYLL